jgi:serine/threonine protein kinase
MSYLKAEKRHPQIALKMFREHLKKYFHKEADNLRKIQAIDHPHLIKPIAAYERGESRCFIFPWADGGNLRDLWKKPDKKRSEPPASDTSLVAWALGQMCGLADCLTTLYAYNCRHGDLKPENILRFTDGIGQGTLVVADFGLAKFHLYETMIRNGNSSILDRTLRYEPPEMEQYMQLPRSRGDDVWSMGCIFLEFAIWLLCGWDYLEQFNNTNKEQKFWEDKDGKHQVHHRVQDEISKSWGI